MTNSKLFNFQLRTMLTGLSEHGISHLTEIESDLLQTNLLLEEAIAKLVASFMAINGAISVHQEMLDALLSKRAIKQECFTGISTISDEIGRHINDAVTSLQFQDMTRQLLERTSKRIAGLSGILGSLGSSGSGMSEDIECEEMLVLLRSINRQLDFQHNDLAERLWQTVRQKHLDSGEIELF